MNNYFIIFCNESWLASMALMFILFNNIRHVLWYARPPRAVLSFAQRSSSGWVMARAVAYVRSVILSRNVVAAGIKRRWTWYSLSTIEWLSVWRVRSINSRD